MEVYDLFQIKRAPEIYSRAIRVESSTEILEALDFQSLGRYLKKRGIKITREQLRIPKKIEKIFRGKCFPTDKGAIDRFMLGYDLSNE